MNIPGIVWPKYSLRHAAWKLARRDISSNPALVALAYPWPRS